MYYRRHHDHHGGDGWWNDECALPAAPVSDARPYAGRDRTDGFFVVEPGANLDFNITHSFRLSLGGSYRWVKGVRSAASTNKELSGPSAMVTFRFGKF